MYWITSIYIKWIYNGSLKHSVLCSAVYCILIYICWSIFVDCGIFIYSCGCYLVDASVFSFNKKANSLKFLLLLRMSICWWGLSTITMNSNDSRVFEYFIIQSFENLPMFLQTGTLTEDGLMMQGVIPTSNSRYVQFTTQTGLVICVKLCVYTR